MMSSEYEGRNLSYFAVVRCSECLRNAVISEGQGDSHAAGKGIPEHSCNVG